MRILSTYIVYWNEDYHKLHECVGMNSFEKTYYIEDFSGIIIEIGKDHALKLLDV